MHHNDARCSITTTHDLLLRSHRAVLTAANTKCVPTRAEGTEAYLPLAHANTYPTAKKVSTYYFDGPSCHVIMFGLPATAKPPTFTQHDREWHIKHNTWSAWCIPGTDEHQNYQKNMLRSCTLKYSAYKASYSKVKAVKSLDARGLFSSIRAVTRQALVLVVIATYAACLQRIILAMTMAVFGPSHVTRDAIKINAGGRGRTSEPEGCPTSA